MEKTVMRLSDVAEMLEADILCRRSDLAREIEHAFAADLMSDVLTLEQPGALLLTGLTNPQVIRTAEVAGIAAIVFVRGKRALPETVRLADEVGIPLLQTTLLMFEACGRLYAGGIRGCSRAKHVQA